jgi:mono/diheme cytochrome c family protein
LGWSGAARAARPPLAAGDWLARPPATLARIVLHGLEGPLEVDGQAWDRAMPAVALDDADLAAVLSFVRVTFAQQPVVTPELVAEVRAASAGRQTAWTAAELGR